MFNLTQRTVQAIQALCCLAGGDCSARSAAEIAACSEVSRAYLPKILRRLGQAGLITARRGWTGGTSLARTPKDISLADICEAMEGPDWLPECLMTPESCRHFGFCPTLVFWKGARKDILVGMKLQSLQHILDQIKTRSPVKEPPPVRPTQVSTRRRSA